MKKTMALLLAVSMILGVMPVFASAADLGQKADKTYIVLAPGKFEDNGEWTTAVDNDTTAGPNAGITYMIAGKDNHATNTEAKSKVVLPADGEYKVYTFTKDFSSRSRHIPLGYPWRSGLALAVERGIFRNGRRNRDCGC